MEDTKGETLPENMNDADFKTSTNRRMEEELVMKEFEENIEQADVHFGDEAKQELKA